MGSIAKNIKKLREEKQLTQEKLAEKLFVTRQAVSNWETGKNQPDIDTLTNLAAVLEVDIKELLYGPPPDGWRRKRALAAVILCALTLVAGGLYFSLIPWARAEASNHYNVIPGYLCEAYLKPLAYLLLGTAIPAVLFISKGLRFKNKALRGTMVGISVLYCAVFWGLGAEMLFGMGIPVPRALRLFYGRVWCRQAWSFLFSGLLLFCGVSGKSG